MKSCENCRYRKIDEDSLPCSACIELGPDLSGWVGATNGDRIRGMADEKLAEFLALPCPAEFRCDAVEPYEDESAEHHCARCLLKWLKEEGVTE